MDLMNIMLPNTMEQLYHALSLSTDRTCLFAGGTDLMIKMRNHPFRYDSIIDLSGISALKKIDVREDAIEVGAMVTLSEIESHPEIISHFSALSQAAGSVGSTQIRNRATFAGNIANASPCADTASALLGLRAKIKIVDDAGQFSLSEVDKIMIGMGKNKLDNNEAIVSCILEKSSGRRVSSFKKLGSRKAVSISKLNLCMVLDLDVDDNILASSVSIGSLGPKPMRNQMVESFLYGKKLSEALIDPLLDVMTAVVMETIPDRSSMPYKRTAIRGLTADVIADIMDKSVLKGGVINV